MSNKKKRYKDKDKYSKKWLTIVCNYKIPGLKDNDRTVDQCYSQFWQLKLGKNQHRRDMKAPGLKD